MRKFVEFIKKFTLFGVKIHKIPYQKILKIKRKFTKFHAKNAKTKAKIHAFFTSKFKEIPKTSLFRYLIQHIPRDLDYLHEDE